MRGFRDSFALPLASLVGALCVLGLCFSMICVPLLLVRLVKVGCYESLMFCCTGKLCIRVRARSAFLRCQVDLNISIQVKFWSIRGQFLAQPFLDIRQCSPRTFASFQVCGCHCKKQRPGVGLIVFCNVWRACKASEACYKNVYFTYVFEEYALAR